MSHSLPRPCLRLAARHASNTAQLDSRPLLSIRSSRPRPASHHLHPSSPLLSRALFGSRSPPANTLYPSSVRREDELSTLLLSSASARRPLLTLWSTSLDPTASEISGVIGDLLAREKVGEEEGGVGYVRVDMDAPEFGGVAGVPLQRYGIDQSPTLLAFDRQEPQIETKVSRIRDLQSRDFLRDWIRVEAARRGQGGAGGSWSRLFGRS